MKIMITWLRKNGNCRTWTNSNPVEHVAMSLTAYSDGVKRKCGQLKVDPEEILEEVKKGCS